MGGLIRAVLLDRLRILMKSAFLSTFVVAVLTMTLVVQNAIADTTFDGTWSVTMSAHNYQNPNSTMSLAYAWHFSMTVKNGILHGERGNRGMGDFYEINGTIAADGTATIRADGITGKGTEFTKGHTSPGTPFSYAVTAQFKGRHGTGKSIGDPRIRIFTFGKD
jgi:hypothetical protein